MKRIIVLFLFAVYLNNAFAGQPGAITKPQIPVNPTAIDIKDIKIDFDSLAKSGEIKSNQLLVKFKETANVLAAPTLQSAAIEKMKSFFSPMKKLASQAKLFSQWKVVTFEKGQSLNNMFSILKNDPNVEYIAPNLKLKIQATIPNDLTADLWGLNNDGTSFDVDDGNGNLTTIQPTAGIDINAPEAWDIRTDASDVVVAVIDTGIDYNHPELNANIWTNPGEIAGNGIDDDGNGYIDDVHGYDFVNRDGDPMDDHGHGTHCSGTIAASGNNGSGVVGVTWSTQLMGVKILSAGGYGYTADIIEGILYAADNGAKVSNNSYGAMVPDAVYAEMLLQPYRDALQAVGESGMLFVAAAGNDSINIDQYGYSVPSSFDLPNIISVAALDYQGSLAEFSNRGYHHTDIAAPGVLIKSTLPSDSYASWNGTSMATPHVVGVAALMKAEAPQLDPVAMKSILMNTVTANDNLTGLVRTGGILNAQKALEALKASCDSFTATPSKHRDAGRAHTCNSWYICADGSNEQIGYSFTSTQVTLTEKSEGYYVTDGSCDASLDLPPTISLIGKVEEYIRVESEYSAESATASDVEDGDLTASIQVSSNVDTSVEGSYIIEYSVTDSAGNRTVETRLIHVLEDSKPNMQLLGPVCSFFYGCEYVRHVVNEPYMDPGYTAWDVLDGDITDRVTYFGDILDNLDQVGNRGEVFYEVTDLDGNTYAPSWGQFRHLVVLHQDNPYILRGDLVDGYVNVFKTYRRDELEGHPVFQVNKPYALDYVDGYLGEDSISVYNPTDYTVAGDYDVIYTATDSEGYTDEVRALVQVIEDVTAPEANTYCDQHAYVELNSDPEDVRYDCAYPVDDLDPSPVREVTGEVDTSIAGDYEVTYRLYDASGNESFWVQTVTVVDGTTPSITSRTAEGGPRSMTISGTAYDPDNNIEKVEVKLHYNMTEWVTVEGTEDWSITLEDLPPANYNVYIRVTDTTGLQSKMYTSQTTINGVFVWDAKIDSIDYSMVGNNVTVFGTASDVDGDLEYIELTLETDGNVYFGIIAEGTDNWSYEFTDLDKGNYRVLAYAYDAENHMSQSAEISFVVGMNKPVIDSYTVTGGEQTVHVTGTASDIDGDLSKILIGIGDSTEWHLANGIENFSLTVTGVEAGSHEVRIWVLDDEDNGDVVTETVVVLPAACVEYVATLSEHEAAGRSYSETEMEGETCWGSFCYGGIEVTTWYAAGSGEELGTDGNAQVTLIEDSGNYVQGECPESPLPPTVESYQIAENSYNQLVVTGVASDPNNDIDRVVLGLGAVTGIVCEGTTNFTCVLVYDDYGFEVGVELSLSVSAWDSRNEGSAVQFFTATRPEQQPSQPPVISNIQQTREGTVEIVTVTVTDVDDDLEYVSLIRLDDIGVVQCVNTSGDQYRCDMQLQGTDYATMTWKVRAIDLAENMTDSEEFTVVWEETPTCFTDTNINHEAAGRAYQQYNILYYANGSDEYLGMSSDTTSLEQQDQPGNWVKVPSCQ